MPDIIIKKTQKKISDYFISESKPVSSTAQTASAYPTEIRRPFRPHRRENNPSILPFFFNPSESKKRARTKEHLQEGVAKVAKNKAKIAVSSRPDGDGRGALYDHQTLQNITNSPTQVITADGKLPSSLKSQIKMTHIALPYGVEDPKVHRLMPESHDINIKNSGLIYIPGVSTAEYKTGKFQERKDMEMKLIRGARLRGQPVLAVCGGLWTFYEQFGGRITEVYGHNYRGGMPRPSRVNADIVNNKMLHRIKVSHEAKLTLAALNIDQQPNTLLPVNSVHGYAADESTLPDDLIISARSMQDDLLASIDGHSEEKKKIKPEPCIEALENKHSGAPFLAVQWHPEAFGSSNPASHCHKNQTNLLKYMAFAGQTYVIRRAMLREFEERGVAVKKELRHTGFLLDHYVVRKARYKTHDTFKIFFSFKKQELRHIDELNLEIQKKEEYLESSERPSLMPIYKK